MNSLFGMSVLQSLYCDRKLRPFKSRPPSPALSPSQYPLTTFFLLHPLPCSNYPLSNLFLCPPPPFSSTPYDPLHLPFLLLFLPPLIIHPTPTRPRIPPSPPPTHTNSTGHDPCTTCSHAASNNPLYQLCQAGILISQSQAVEETKTRTRKQVHKEAGRGEILSAAGDESAGEEVPKSLPHSLPHTVTCRCDVTHASPSPPSLCRFITPSRDNNTISRQQGGAITPLSLTMALHRPRPSSHHAVNSNIPENKEKPYECQCPARQLRGVKNCEENHDLLRKGRSIPTHRGGQGAEGGLGGGGTYLPAPPPHPTNTVTKGLRSPPPPSTSFIFYYCLTNFTHIHLHHLIHLYILPPSPPLQPTSPPLPTTCTSTNLLHIYHFHHSLLHLHLHPLPLPTTSPSPPPTSPPPPPTSPSPPPTLFTPPNLSFTPPTSHLPTFQPPPPQPHLHQPSITLANHPTESKRKSIASVSLLAPNDALGAHFITISEATPSRAHHNCQGLFITVLTISGRGGHHTSRISLDVGPPGGGADLTHLPYKVKGQVATERVGTRQVDTGHMGTKQVRKRQMGTR
ncbi:hypothetical protein C7M84_021856 [Penaeus vannamei]|uniref:Uncharacterized protein n=1 Tax=Penaeus vannamei TaxID=6689 RepID=A0A3R7NEB6_PENVA|nr:hypothetical protein C7M84_021856 [Penaeus vannamei]